MTFSAYYANKKYGNGNKEKIKEIEEKGIVVIDEVDLLSEEVKGAKEAFNMLFKERKRLNVIGLSATPDKVYGKIEEKGVRLKVMELESESMEYHCKMIKLVNKSNKSVGFVGKKRVKEIIEHIKVKYENGWHMLLFYNNGEFTKDISIDNCVFSDNNENIDRKKLLKSKGVDIFVKSKDKKIEITQCSNVGSRLYSVNLEGFIGHTNVYIGEYNPDVPEQHFRRVREHSSEKIQ